MGRGSSKGSPSKSKICRGPANGKRINMASLQRPLSRRCLKSLHVLPTRRINNSGPVKVPRAGSDYCSGIGGTRGFPNDRCQATPRSYSNTPPLANAVGVLRCIYIERLRSTHGFGRSGSEMIALILPQARPNIKVVTRIKHERARQRAICTARTALRFVRARCARSSLGARLGLDNKQHRRIHIRTRPATSSAHGRRV